MEQKNYVLLRGHVGNARLSSYGESCVNNFSVATNAITRTSDGTPVEDTQWTSCVAWSSKKYPDVSIIATGTPIEVEGRLRTRKYDGSDGHERTVTEVQVTDFKILPKGEKLTTPVL